MRRLILTCGLAALVLLSASATVAAPPIGSCPAASSGFEMVDRDGWWERTVAGFESEGIQVYDPAGNFTAAFDAFAAQLGFADGADLEAFVRGEQWDEIDKNTDGFVCMKPHPRGGSVGPGSPAYLFVGTDNTARAGR